MAVVLPCTTGAFKGMVMQDCLLHIRHPRRFFAEAARCVCSGGVMLMIEPWVTPWSRLIYTRLHHEPFHPEAREWEVSGSRPLSGARSALPYILFARDRLEVEREFPMWHIQTIQPIMPFRYLISG